MIAGVLEIKLSLCSDPYRKRPMALDSVAPCGAVALAPADHHAPKANDRLKTRLTRKSLPGYPTRNALSLIGLRHG
jgi:hypothetical protein